MEKYVIKIINRSGVGYYDTERMAVDKAETFFTNVPSPKSDASLVVNEIFDTKAEADMCRDGLAEQEFEMAAAYGDGIQNKYVVEKI